MTGGAARYGALAGLLAGLAAASWAAGTLALLDPAADFDGGAFGPGVDALWVALALLAALVAPSLRSAGGWRDGAGGLAALLAATAPVFALALLAGATTAGAIGTRALLLAAEGVLLFGALAGVDWTCRSLFARRIGTALVQTLAVCISLEALSHWSGWSAL